MANRNARSEIDDLRTRVEQLERALTRFETRSPAGETSSVIMFGVTVGAPLVRGGETEMIPTIFTGAAAGEPPKGVASFQRLPLFDVGIPGAGGDLSGGFITDDQRLKAGAGVIALLQDDLALLLGLDCLQLEDIP